MEEVEEAPLDDGFAAAERTVSPFRAGPGSIPSGEPAICQFLGFEELDGSLTAALPIIDPANRCTAVGGPIPQSNRQQQLVCLTSSHVDCPRFLRGVLGAGALAPVPARAPISPAVIGAGLALAAALAASFGFLAVRGGFDLELMSPAPSRAAVAVVPSAGPPAVVIASSSLAPAPSPSPTPQPSPSASPSPTPGPSPTLSPTPRPTAKPTAAPTSNRFALLTKCPSAPDCWIYVIRAGDNLRSIANYFGVSYDRVLAVNPGIGDPTNVRPGFRLRIPTPTR
ncbi:MAG: LysM peptidoglycan-binding domain-containing protein [Chloroflexi bacterium]|nr:LysM peptidoglycan-binding domain-containing protein [Chloroflexota bacterium]